MTAYTLGHAARICGVSRRRLRYWERTALLDSLTALPQKAGKPRPKAKQGRQEGKDGRHGKREKGETQTAFDFRALVSLRAIASLRQQGVPLQRIRSSLSAVRARIPDDEPLPFLRAFAETGGVVVRHEGVLMEPDGQLVLEWSPQAGVESLAAGRPGERGRQRALEWFERGCELDADEETWEQAADAYRRALEADPDLADAHCNLGSVCFNQGRREAARACFERAVEIHPGHVEANLNLGTMREEADQDEAALRHYRAALGTDPLFPDTHVSLALCYEKLGLPRTARAHWRRYLMLEATGAWAAVPRRRLSED